MKVKAHVIISKGYGTAITASQWLNELQESCDGHNAEYCGSGWQFEPRNRIVVTVEFEVPDDAFDPPEILEVKGTLVGEDKEY